MSTGSVLQSFCPRNHTVSVPNLIILNFGKQKLPPSLSSYKGLELQIAVGTFSETTSSRVGMIDNKRQDYFVMNGASYSFTPLSAFGCEIAYSNTINPRILFESQAEVVSYFKVLSLISRYKGSYLKGASCKPFQSFKK